MAKTRITMGVVGQIASSMLTEAQFQSINGPSWVLMDGRSVVGSSYAILTGNSTIPDARGVVLRGKNNGRADGNQNPAADRPLGEYEADQLQGHRHNSLGGGQYIQTNSSGTIRNFIGTSPAAYEQSTTGDLTTNGSDGTPRTGTETRTKNITVNHFIKIN